MPRPSFLIERRVDVRSVTIEVYSEYVRKSSRLAGVQGAGNVTEVIIIPDNSWDGMAKTITWFDAHGENPVKVILPVDGAKKLEDGRYAWSSLIPPEPLKYAGECSFVMDGFVDGKRARTIGDKMEVAFAPYAEDPADPSDPTPSQAEQLQKQMDQILATIQDANDAAKSAEESLNAIHEAIDNLPEGATLVIDNMTTGGKAAALSAEQGKLLGSLSNLTNPQLALANLGAGVRPNLARNPDFKINQRNFSSEDWRSGYGPDGWSSTGGGGLEYSGGPVKTNNQYLLQFYEPGEIVAGIYTISALCTDNIQAEIGFWGGSSVGEPSANYDNGIASVTIEIPESIVDSGKNPYLYILCKNNGTISYVKVERGPNQTLAYQKSDGTLEPIPQPDSKPGQILAECHRYLYSPFYGAFPTAPIGTVFVSNQTTGFVVVKTPVLMRTKPVFSGDPSKLWIVKSNGGGAQRPSALSVMGMSGCGVFLSVTASFEDGGQYIMYSEDISNPADFLLSAEL